MIREMYLCIPSPLYRRSSSSVGVVGEDGLERLQLVELPLVAHGAVVGLQKAVSLLLPRPRVPVDAPVAVVVVSLVQETDYLLPVLAGGMCSLVRPIQSVITRAG
jgi:hypothetical protein